MLDGLPVEVECEEGAIHVDVGEDESSLLDATLHLIHGVVVRRRRRRGRVVVWIC
jgi:hypothetical protein